MFAHTEPKIYVIYDDRAQRDINEGMSRTMLSLYLSQEKGSAPKSSIGINNNEMEPLCVWKDPQVPAQWCEQEPLPPAAFSRAPHSVKCPQPRAGGEGGEAAEAAGRGRCPQAGALSVLPLSPAREHVRGLGRSPGSTCWVAAEQLPAGSVEIPARLAACLLCLPRQTP